MTQPDFDKLFSFEDLTPQKTINIDPQTGLETKTSEYVQYGIRHIEQRYPDGAIRRYWSFPPNLGDNKLQLALMSSGYGRGFPNLKFDADDRQPFFTNNKINYRQVAKAIWLDEPQQDFLEISFADILGAGITLFSSNLQGDALEP